jgi:hypothetical protein
MTLLEALNRTDTHSVNMERETEKLLQIASNVRKAETRYLLYGCRSKYNAWQRWMERYAKQYALLQEYLTPYIY